MSTNNIISAIYPSYIGQFLIGCAPIKISQNRNILKITHRRVYDCFIIIILLVIILFIWYRYTSMTSDDFNNNGLVKFIATVYFLTVTGLISTNVINTRVQKYEMAEFLYKLNKVDKEIRNNAIKLKYSNIKRFSTKFLFVGFGSFTIYLLYLVSTQKFRNKLQGNFSYGLLYLAIINHISYTCSFVTIIKIVKNMAEEIMKKIEDLLLQQVSLIRIMKLHQEIYELLQMGSKIYAAQLLFSFAVSFMIITFQTYTIFCAVYNNSPYLKYSFASIIWIVFFVIEKMVLTFSCHKCMFRVSFGLVMLSPLRINILVE